MTKEVFIKWGSRNKLYFTDQGYIFTKMKDEFLVDVHDLQKTNPAKVEVKCDYCNKILSKQWCNYLDERALIEKDSCYQCRFKKEDQVAEMQNNKGLLVFGDRKYWKNRENRLYHLKEYVEKFGNVYGMENNPEGKSLYSVIIRHKETPIQLALELGYDLEKVALRFPAGYVMSQGEIESKIKEFIALNNRFPTSTEIKRDLRIRIKHFLKYGGLNDYKRRMNYEDKNDLKDSSGFYNSSMYELLTANILIENNIPYTREQTPFKEYNYRSDFTLYYEDRPIHIEVWGYSNDRENNMIAKEYNKTRSIKEELYRSMDIKLISIEPSDFDKKSYHDIQVSIINKIKEYVNCELQVMNYVNIIPSSIKTDDELFEDVMSISKDKNTPPTTVDLANEGLTSVYNEIKKRYDTYSDFLEKYGHRPTFKANNYWNDEVIFDTLDHMLNKYGKILVRNEVEKYKNTDDKIMDISKIFGVIGRMCSFGSLFNLKLEFFKRHLSAGNHLPQVEIDWIKKMVINKTRRGNTLVSEEYQKLAQELINKINISNVS